MTVKGQCEISYTLWKFSFVSHGASTEETYLLNIRVAVENALRKMREKKDISMDTYSNLRPIRRFASKTVFRGFMAA